MLVMERMIFMGANTPDGFTGFYDQIQKNYNLKKFYVLKGPGGSGKSTFIKKFVKKLGSTQVEWLVCSGDPKSMDGAIMHDIGIAIVDGTEPHVVNSGDIINLWKFVDDGIDIYKYKKQKTKYYKLAYKYLGKARHAHNQIEDAYKGRVNFKEIDKLLEQVIMEHAINTKTNSQGT